jgi:hypothetical protein
VSVVRSDELRGPVSQLIRAGGLDQTRTSAHMHKTYTSSRNFKKDQIARVETIFQRIELLITQNSYDPEEKV